MPQTAAQTRCGDALPGPGTPTGAQGRSPVGGTEGRTEGGGVAGDGVSVTTCQRELEDGGTRVGAGLRGGREHPEVLFSAREPQPMGGDVSSMGIGHDVLALWQGLAA